MNRTILASLELEQYRCRRCGRVFYVNPAEMTAFDVDFGCPYGCDDNGRHVGNIQAIVKRHEQMGDTNGAD